MEKISINIIDLAQALTEESLMKYPHKGKIDTNYGAVLLPLSSVLEVGPLREKPRYHYNLFLERVNFCVNSMKKLEQLAQEAGFRVVHSGTEALDGPLREFYRFQSIEKK